MGGFFSQDNPPPLEQAEGGTPPGNVVVQEPTGVDGATSSFFGRGQSPQIQAFEEEAKQAAEAAAASAEEAEDAATAAAGSAQNALNTASGIETSVAVAVASKNEAQASAALAQQAVTTTQNSAAAAATSAGQAATSATNAQNSASGAATSSSQAASSAQNAAASAGAAASSASNIQTAANTATTKAVEAATSATQAASSATAAAGSATNAASSVTASSTNASNAAASATTASTAATTATTKSEEAATSATNAAGSATAAAGSATGAAGSATTATTKASEAASSATAAAGSATTATTKASEAATSATSAAGSATSATGSAVAADTSADQALASADAAAGSATSAGTSASNAAGSANSANIALAATVDARDDAYGYRDDAALAAQSAAGSAATATTKAAEASTSATAASGSASSASTSASTATTKAAEASTSATNAATSATAAGTSATNAAASATAAGTSATNASNSATAAAGSASNANIALAATEDARDDAYGYRDDAALAAQSAASARDATLAAFDSFDDRYLGVKTSNPTVDNDGNALVAGALYFNSTAGEMRVYTGTAWAAAYVSGAGVLLISNNLSDVANAATARTNLGLGNVENKSSATIRGEITSGNVTTALGFTPYNATNPAGYTTNTGTVTSVGGTGTVSGLTLSGSVTGSGNLTLGGTLSLTSGNVTTALGYTPYNATNPSGYITGITSGNVTTALGYTPVNRAGDTMTGNLTVNNTVTAAILGSTAYNTPSLLRPIVGDDNWAFGAFQSGENYWMQVQFYGVGDDNRGFRVLDKNGGVVRFRVNGAGSAIASGDMRAPIFYDSDNTAYYINGAGNSVLNTLYMRNGSIEAKFAQASQFGYSSSYRTVVLGNEYLTTISMGVDVSGNASGSFNGQGEGREVLFRNGVTFITPNSANNGYLPTFNMTDGYVTSGGSVRSPIFYDSDNTAYYVDPNGGSRTGGITADSLQSLGNLTVNSGLVYRSDWTTRFQSGSDFVDGTLVTTDIPATGWAGDSFVIEITGKSYDQNNPPFKVIAQGYLYADTIINYSGISYAGNFASYIKVFQDGGVLKFWWPRISYWNSFNVNVMSMDGQTNGTITRNRVTAIGNSTEPTGTKKQQINLSRFMRGDVSATNSVDVRAPIFYDSDNTGYFLDPNSSGLALRTSGYWIADSTAWAGDIDGKIQRHNNSWYFSASNFWVFRATNGSEPFTVNQGGTAIAAADMRAPIFYDNNDTAYYGDFAGTSRLNNLQVGGTSSPDSAKLSAIRTNDGGTALYVGTGSQGVFIKNDPANATTVQYFSSGSSGGSHRFLSGNTPALFITGDYAEGAGSLRAPIFYDSNNTGYYVDPNEVSKTWRMGANYFQSNDDVSADTPFGLYFANGLSSAYAIYREAGAWSYPYPDLRIAFHTGIKMGANSGYGGMKFYTDYDMSSQVMSINNGADGLGAANVFINNNLQVNGNIRTPIYYDVNDTGYYLDPNSTSDVAMRMRGGMLIGPNPSWGAYLRVGSNGWVGDHSSIAVTNGNLHLDAQPGFSLYLAWYNTSTINVGGSIVANGNITAYSDIRVKDNVETIPNALDKLDQIRGVTYTRTDRDDKERRYAGVIAQEIEKVLPEAIFDNEEYKSVDYNATIGLLIQAVKELRDEVEAFKGKSQ